MKKVLVLGSKKSGVASAKLLAKQGYLPCIFDDKAGINSSLPATAIRVSESEVLAGVCDYDFAVASPGVPSTNSVLTALDKAGVKVVSELELGYTALKAPCIAVTGTNGKSTTVSLIAKALSSLGKRAVACGNIGLPVSDVALDPTLADLAVMEVSSFQLERTYTVHPRIAVITNVGRDHLDRHGTFATYADLKFSLLKNMTESDVAVLNHDDEATQERADGVKAKIIWFSKKERLTRGVYLHNGEVYHTIFGREKKVCSLSAMKLRFPTDNFLSALAVTTVLGMPETEFVNVAKNFVPEENTLTPVAEICKVKFFNDSKGTNPDATVYAVRQMNGKCVLIAGGRNKGNDFLPMARATKDKLRAVVALGECADEVTGAFRSAGFRDVVRVKSLVEAVRLAYEMAYPGDSVLFSPASASFDSYSNYKERGRKFVDAVRRLGER